MKDRTIPIWIGVAIAVASAVGLVAFRLMDEHGPFVDVPLLLLFAAGVTIAISGQFRSRMSQLEEARSMSSRDLQESEARFKQLFLASPFPATVTRLPDGKVLAANESANVRFGARLVDGLDLFSSEFHADLSQRALITERMRKEGFVNDHLLPMKTAAGQVFWASMSARAITYDGQPATLSVFHDVTNQVAAEQAMRASEQRLASQSEALTALMERQARTTSFDDRLHDILETCAHTMRVARTSVWQFSEDRAAIDCLDLYEEAGNRHSTGQHLPRSSFPAYFRAIEHERLIAARDAMTDPLTNEFTESYLKPNRISSMLDIPLHQNERVAGVMCLEHIGDIRNWTADEENFALAIANLFVVALTDRDRRIAAERLAESEQRARLVVDTAHDAFIGMNSDGRIVSWNAQAVSTFGWSREEAIGKTLAETIIPPAFREGHRQGLQRFLKSGEAPVVNQRLELSALHKSSGEFPIEITITSPIRWDNGYFFGAFARDISSRKQKEQELRQARDSAEAATRAKSEFLANMSHELRTPLNGVLGYAQLLQRSKTLTADQRESLDAISKCGSHLLDLINDILDLSKIEAGHMELEPVPTDLHQLTVDLAHVIAEPARRKGLSFSVNVAADVPARVVVDGRHIRQILLNLLGNAVKFTPAGSIDLSVSRTPAGKLEFRVTDTGVGIEEENLLTIFEEFRQTRTGSSAGGTGLGLTISQKLVRAMGSELAVESRLNEGSSFYFELPLIAAESSATPAAEADSETHGSHLAPESHLMALVVDDSSINRRILASLLESAGAQVIAAGSGAEALELSVKYQPNIILMDLRMNEMDGLETTRKILANPATASIPIIMVTASAFGDARRAALEAGCVDFITKPIRAEQLFQKLQRHLNVRFVDQAEQAVDITNTTLPTGPAAESRGERLYDAASIGNIAELEELALELARGEELEANLGKRIKILAAQFDFGALLELADAMRNPKDKASAG